ncbi:MAG: hypothetical protein ACK5LT_13965 [Lachnospirales bacterium]
MLKNTFQRVLFSDCNLDDTFFNSLKDDYAGFIDWFQKKCKDNNYAYILKDNDDIKAFIYLKIEGKENPSDQITCNSNILPEIKRIKIGTLKIDETGKRYGEGAIGLALWYWQLHKDRPEEIYFIIFKKQKDLIDLSVKFGFKNIGKNENGELIMLKSRKDIDYSTPYKSFPFINSKIEKVGILPINDNFHYTLFQYSNLKNT